MFLIIIKNINQINTEKRDKIINLTVLVSIYFMPCIIIKQLYSVHKSFFEKVKVHQNSMLI